jgi:hypothetical protein
MDIQKPKVNVAPSNGVPVRMNVNVPTPPAPQPAPQGLPQMSPAPLKQAPKPDHTPTKTKPWKLWLLIGLVVLLASGGAYAWQQYTLGSQISTLEDDNSILKTKARQAEEAALQNAEELKKLQAGGAATTAAATAAADFFEVKELGFKFKPGADLKDLVYIIDGTNARFSTRSLMAAAYKEHRTDVKEEFWCTPGFGPLGVVAKPTADAISKKTVTATPPQASCSDVKTVNDLATAQLGKLKEALKTTEEIK